MSRDGPNIVWFHVLYDDMDEEEYELTEVLSILDFGSRNVKPTRNREKALPDAEQLKIVTGMKSNAMEAASTFVSDLRKLSPTEGGCACCTGVGGCARDCILTQSSKDDDYCLDLAKMIDVVPGLKAGITEYTSTQLVSTFDDMAFDFTKGPEADFSTLKTESTKIGGKEVPLDVVNLEHESEDDDGVDPNLLFIYVRNICIKKEHLASVKSPTVWLKDDVVNFGVLHEIIQSQTSNVNCIDSLLFNCKLKVDVNGRQIKDFSEYFLSDKAFLCTFEELKEVTLFPINIKDNHWTLTVIIKSQAKNAFKIIYMDSFGEYWDLPCQLISNVLKEKYNADVEIVKANMERLQDNSHDCGCFVIRFCERICLMAKHNIQSMYRPRNVNNMISDVMRYTAPMEAVKKRAMLVRAIER